MEDTNLPNKIKITKKVIKSIIVPAKTLCISNGIKKEIDRLEHEEKNPFLAKVVLRNINLLTRLKIAKLITKSNCDISPIIEEIVRSSCKRNHNSQKYEEEILTKLIESIMINVVKNSNHNIYDSYIKNMKNDEILDITKLTQEIAIDSREDNNYKKIETINEELTNSTINPTINLDFFNIDDKRFLEELNDQINEETIYIKGRCREETIYCLLNVLKNEGKDNSVLIVFNTKTWDKLTRDEIKDHILIPWFEKSEIAAIKGNTNIFVFNSNNPIFCRNYLELRPRTRTTIYNALVRCGLDYETASKMMRDTNGIFPAIKKKIFKGAIYPNPKWEELDNNIKNTCILVGRWKERKKDIEIIEELSGVPYNEFKMKISPYISCDDPFLYFSNINEPEYCLSSFDNTWNIYVIKDNKTWNRYYNVVVQAFTSNWGSQIKGDMTYVEATAIQNETYSKTIREGLLKTLLLRAINSNEGQYEANEVVQTILDGIKNINDFNNISSYWKTMCEISPQIIIDSLTDKSKPNNLMKLIEGLKNEEYEDKFAFQQLIYGVEEFFCQEEYCESAVDLIVELDQNSNINQDLKKELTTIFGKMYCIWRNFTIFDTPNKKISLIDKCYKINKNTFIYVLESLDMYNNNIGTEFNKPEYRSYLEDTNVSKKNIENTVDNYLDFIIGNLKENINKDNTKEVLEQLLKMAFILGEENRNRILKSVIEIAQNSDSKTIEDIKNIIIDDIYKNRFYTNPEWVLSGEKVGELEGLLTKINNPLMEGCNTYLFVDRYTDITLNPISMDTPDEHNLNKEKVKAEVIDTFNYYRNNIEKLYITIDYLSSNNRNSLGQYLGMLWSEELDEVLLKELNKMDKGNYITTEYLTYYMLYHKGKCKHVIEGYKKKYNNLTVLVELYRIELEVTLEKPIISEEEEEIKKLFWSHQRACRKENTEWVISECYKYGNNNTLLEQLYLCLEINASLSSDYIIDYLKKVDVNEIYDNYIIKSLIRKIYNKISSASDYQETMALLELKFITFLDWEDLISLKIELKKNPLLYSKIVDTLFKHDDEEKRKKIKVNKKYKDMIYKLYFVAQFCPCEENGRVEFEELKKWLDDFKCLLIANKQEGLFSHFAGKLLSNAPVEEDGTTPCESVRKVIEELYNDEFASSFVTSIYNKRGVYSPSDGNEEYNMAMNFKNVANKLSEYPKTAKLFNKLSSMYMHESEREREYAESGY